MNLYLISQNKNNNYDTYSDAVVAAVSEEDAKTIHPGSSEKKLPAGPEDAENNWTDYYDYVDWVRDTKDVRAVLIGKAADGIERGTICASFHAG